MKKVLLGIVALLVLILGAAAVYYYGFKSGAQLTVIPKDAAVVVKADFKSLAGKANLEKLKTLDFYKDLEKEMKTDTSEQSKYLQNIFAHPTSTGVNIVDDVYGFGARSNDESYGGIAFGILSASKLEETINKMPGKKGDIEKANGIYSYAIDNSSALAWNADKAVVVIASRKTAQDLAKQLIGQKKEESIAGDKCFKQFIATKADVGMYMNYGTIMKMVPGNKLAAVVLPDAYMDMMNDTKVSMALNFEPNKVVVTGQVYHNDAKNAISFTSDKGVSGDLLKTITDKEVLGEMSMAFNKEKIMELVRKIPKYDEMLGQAATELKISKTDLEDAVGDKWVMAMTGFNQHTQIKEKFNPAFNFETYDANMPMYITDTQQVVVPIFTVSMASTKKDVWHKLLEQPGITKANGYYTMKAGGGMDACIVETNAGITLTNDSALALKLAGKKQFDGEPNEPANTLIKQNPVSFYLNLDETTYPQIVRDYTSKSLGAAKYASVSKFLKEFKGITGHADSEKSTFELVMKDGNGSDNSLYRIISLASEMSKKPASVD